MRHGLLIMLIPLLISCAHVSLDLREGLQYTDELTQVTLTNKGDAPYFKLRRAF